MGLAFTVESQRKRYYGYSSRCQCGGPSGWIDHAFHVRIKGTRGEASVLTVSQSYNPNGEGLDSLKTALGFLFRRRGPLLVLPWHHSPASVWQGGAAGNS